MWNRLMGSGGNVVKTVNKIMQNPGKAVMVA